jgi:hypothetical protein
MITHGNSSIPGNRICITEEMFRFINNQISRWSGGLLGIYRKIQEEVE